MINSGHYYTLYNRTQWENQREAVPSLFELNDAIVKKYEHPCQRLDKISGKQDSPVHQFERHGPWSGAVKSSEFGDTGYMYFYQKVLLARKENYPFEISPKLLEHFEKENER